MRGTAVLLLAALLGACGTALGAERLDELLGHPVEDRRGDPLGKVSELIVDVRAGRVLYAVVDAGGRYFTFPARALQGDAKGPLSVDRSLADAAAEQREGTDPRFARAGRLVGQALEHPDGKRIGTIEGMVVDLESGRIDEVLVRTEQGSASFPPSVLAGGRFPPLTRWQSQQPPSEPAGNAGYVRREPSDERRSVQGR